MNGEIIQAVTLVLHAQTAIHDGKIDADFLQNSAFKFCKSVEFFGEKKASFFQRRVERRKIFRNPFDWINSLKKMKVKCVMLSSLKPPSNRNLGPETSVAFVGGGNYWTIDIFDANQYLHSFHPVWRVGDQNDSSRKPWHVIYEQLKINPYYDENLLTAKQNFLEALTEITEFSASDARLSNWTKVFERAHQQLEGVDQQVFHPDFSPEGFLSTEARNLLRTCQVGWVFGGMGSWNDIWTDDAEQYKRVTKNYFNAIDCSVTAATNSRYL